MPHLTLEALARLVDEAPTREEAEHLRECDVCQAELDALRSQTDSLAALPKMSPPPDLWPELRSRLRKEGLVAGRSTRTATLIRIAAALAVFVAGGAMGYTVRGPAAPVASTSAPMEVQGELAADPVINSYHLTAVAQRNELLRQIAASGEPIF